MSDPEWEDFLSQLCAESAKLDLKPCPFCGKREFLRAGHLSSQAFGVECMNCRCTGPVWSYRRVTGDDECLLPEILAEVERRKAKKYVYAETCRLLPRGPLNHLDAYLLEKAIEGWNKRDDET
jgi:hypothetical protein